MSTCIIRPDINHLGMPVGDHYISVADTPETGFEYRWKEDGDEDFEILSPVTGNWEEAYSIDYDFTEVKEVA